MHIFSKADGFACHSSSVLLPGPNLWRSEYIRKIAQTSLGTDSIEVGHHFWSDKILLGKYFDLHIDQP